MTTDVVCATDEFWNLVEVQTKCIIPTYLKNVLKLSGYDNALSVKSLTDDDIKTLESFARTKMRMFIPTGANYTDYYDRFSAHPECFEIVPGHVKMLKSIAKQIDVIQETTPSGHSVSTTCSELDYSNQENDHQLIHSRNDDRSQTAAIHILQEEPFKAFIVDGSPEHFSIHLESTLGELDRIEALLKPASTWAVFNKTLVGQMCAARFGDRYYRGIILSSDDKGTFIHYIDYGNKTISTDLRQLPDDLLLHRYLALDCRLASKDGIFSPQLVGRFGNLSRDDSYEVKFIDKESHPAIVELFVDGELFEENLEPLQVPEGIIDLTKQFDYIEDSNKKFDKILDSMYELLKKHQPHEMPKFTDPTSLQDGNYVVIRYVESPTLFYVQQTKSIADYDAMTDRLMDYYATAPTIRQPQIGMACVATYNSGTEWYRVEILDIGTDDALTRFVDYGIELTIRINQLREIGNEFLLMPKQAIPCCILGFESLKATKTIKDKLEFLAESSTGDRRKFQVFIHGIVNGTTLVNLIDLTQSPILDLSMLLLELSLPREKFREYRQKTMQKIKRTPPQPAPSNADLSLLNTVNDQLCRIIATEHLARQLRWQYLFFYHLSQIDNVVQTALQSQDGVYHQQNPPKLKKDSVQMRMISNTLQQSNEEPFHPNMTSPSMDHSMNPVEKMQPPTVVIPKFIEPTALSDGDFVVIRYVESPKLFCVQQTKNIVEHNAMLDKLCNYCLTAPSLNKFSKGVACASRYKNDSEWYRAEIVSVSGTNATIRFVDYGIELQTEVAALKEIHYDFLMEPKQAVPCCLLGFESMQTVNDSSQHRMNLLAENSLGERRNFQVTVHGKMDDVVLVNLMDESQLPHLDFSLRMLQLSLPKTSFRQNEMRFQNNAALPQPVNAPRAADIVDQSPLNEKTTSDSGFQEDVSTSTRISNYETPDRRSNTRVNNARDDRSVSNSSAVPETTKIDVKESKTHGNPNLNNDQRNSRPSKSYAASSNLRRDTLSPEGPVDPTLEAPIKSIANNNSHQVTLSWFFSPLEFFVTTIESDTDLAYISQKKNIHFFYKNKPCINRMPTIGSLVIAKYSKNNELHRVRIVDYDSETGKYKAQLIDLGALTIVNRSDLYEMDKIFAKLECRAIKCSFPGVALRVSRFDMEDIVDKLMDKKLSCKFIERKADTFYVDINLDGMNIRDTMLRDNYLSILSDDIELERLIGQTVMAQIVSVKDPSSFQIVICGCETIFQVACHKTATSNGKSYDKKIPKGETILIRIESFLVGKAFSVTPLVGEISSSPICNIPFFTNNFKVYVMHWEDYNVAYVHSLTAHNMAETLLNELFELYDKNGDLLKDLAPGALCAVKSSDENWYRAEIINEMQSEINVRYLDYGNCEVIPKSLVKRLDSKFLNTPALAVKVYLPLQKVYSDRETSVDEIVKLTADAELDLKVLDSCDRNWIVDMFMDNASITATIKQKNCCRSMGFDELKKQIAQCETLQKVARLLAQKERGNVDVKMSPIVTSEVHKDNAPPKSKPQPLSIQSPSQPESPQQVHGEKTTKMNAYISHIDQPDRFYLQISSTCAALEKLQEDIQIVAPSLAPLDDFSTDTRCIVRYSVDEQWYRSAIIDSGSGITSIQFIDYGNIDTITDNSFIKATNDAFDRISPYAIPCSLPLEAKDRMEWSEEACELLKDLVDKELEFEYVCKGKTNNFVKLYQGDCDFMRQLIDGGHAIKLESIKSGTNCYVSHINSISDFYIQMESDTEALEKVSDYLLDVSKFQIMENIKEGVVCAAKYSDDGLWYRAKILSRKADSTEVFFVDYGNTSLTNDLRIIPDTIANVPSLARYCSLTKPKDIQYWSENAERLFSELTDNSAIFVVNVVSPGKKSNVDLLAANKSILEDITPLCERYSLSQLENTLQSNVNATTGSEMFKAQIVDGPASKFYIQLQSDSADLDQMLASFEMAPTWPVLGDVVVGQTCAAIFDGSYYRAKILSLGEGGALVHYVDYGNQSFSNDLRKLPEDLMQHKPLVYCCRLESVTPQLTERFEKLCKDDTYEMKFVSKESSPAVVELFVGGVKFGRAVQAYISELISPNEFYIQLNNDMEASMASAHEFPLLDESQKCAGKICAALWENEFYRAEIMTVGEEGIKVHFIDYGNESYAIDLRKLPDNLEKIERASMLCALENDKDEFSSDFINKFMNLDLDQGYEFEILTDASPRKVRLYVNGDAFVEEGKTDTINVPKSGHTSTNGDKLND